MKRAIACVLCLVLCVCLLTSCSKGVEKASDVTSYSPKYDKDLEGEVRIGGTFKNFEALEEVFIDFKAIYPNVETSYFAIDNQSEVLNKIIVGNEAPDIIFTSSYLWDYPDLYKDVKDHATVLNDEVLDIDLSILQESLVLSDANGDIRFYPAFLQSSGMLVNKKILADNGLSIPTTYSALVDSLEKLKAAGYDYPLAGSDTGDGWEFVYPAMAQGHFLAGVINTPEKVDKLNNGEEGSEQALVDTLRFVKDFVSLGYVDEALSQELGNGYDAVIMRFFEGDIPFMMTNANTVTGMAKRQRKSDAYQANPFDYSFVPFPYSDHDIALPVYDLFGFILNNTATNKDVALEFLRFLSQKAEMDKLCDIKGAPRITKGAAQQGHMVDLQPYMDKLMTLGWRNLKDDSCKRLRLAVNAAAKGMEPEEAAKLFFAEEIAEE